MQIGYTFGTIIVRGTILVYQRKDDGHWYLAGGDMMDDMTAHDVLPSYMEQQTGHQVDVTEQVGPAYPYQGGYALLWDCQPYGTAQVSGTGSNTAGVRFVTLAEAMDLPFGIPEQQRMALDALTLTEKPAESPAEFLPHERPEGVFVSECGEFLHDENPHRETRWTWRRVNVPGAVPPPEGPQQ